jgi:aminopeptidase N
MRTDTPQPVKLADYQPFPFTIKTTDLEFTLDPTATRVRSTLNIERRGDAHAPLVLNGENLELLGVRLNGEVLGNNAYQLTDETLTIENLPEQFELVIETRFSPDDNRALSGLYMSAGRYCTQCEAEGFRRITYYPDRPDVMSRFSTRIEALADKFPTLLSNGNLMRSGTLEGGRHFTQWQDPFPKPAYLFALVAGEFDMTEDHFTTMSGRDIPLRIYVDPGDAPLSLYAMDALKRAMRWDEEVFGREYDLDLFMIVAVRDFNFGAMENKGLNVFNSSVLLADPKTATDSNYERIESVVAHEYFHNWTGNRITCRDWFQLCLKEGLTVFRDQEFSADMRGTDICRIKDVISLRARQFPEDAGPLAHPVRPDQYLKIDNFYTATIYEKGAELIRMLKTLIGDEAFKKGMDCYFDTLDGTAATIEQFLEVFEQAARTDLSAFKHWYSQAGTPHITVSEAWDAVKGELTLTISQQTRPTPGQPDKRPLPMPIRVGLVGDDGPVPMRQKGESDAGPLERILVLENETQSWTFSGLETRPLVSLLRKFSAPVHLEQTRKMSEHARLITQDPDLFRRWEEAQVYGLSVLTHLAKQKDAPVDPAYIYALAALAADPAIDPAFAALAMLPPSENTVFQYMQAADPGRIHLARENVIQALANTHSQTFLDVMARHQQNGPFSPDAKAAGQRALTGAALGILARLGPKNGGALAQDAYHHADNMTDSMAALGALDRSGSAYFETALEDFYSRWRDNPLVLDKWFAVQASSARHDVLPRIERLLEHPDFTHDNPNRVRSLIGVFSQANPAAFHALDGSGYALLARQVKIIDPLNPALAARLMGAFESWRQLEPNRSAKIKAILVDVLNTPNLSANSYEIISRQLEIQ